MLRAEVRHCRAGGDLAGLQHLLGVLGGPRDVFEDQHQFEEGVVAGLAVLGVDEVAEFIGDRDEAARPAQQVALALGVAQRAPGAGGGARGGDGRGHRLGVGDRVGGDGLAGGRVDRGQHGLTGGR